jgi:SpoVK/Ycf46/Vps4 family AAA+-type ATPase
MSGRLILSSEWLRRFFEGREVKPDYGPDFPARLITTAMDWEDLVLNHYTLGQIQDIKTWLEYNGQVLQDKVLQRKIKPGYRVLFYGPSGTGKTLTATLLGKQFGKDVYRIDLSQIVSKYIGETEKNLERVFSKAENKDWILFFDEADALFGKRTNVQNAHDRYANQEVSYLLQRVEEFPGLLILASNFKNNIDEAFARRLHAIVNFPAPSASERLSLWQKTMPASLRAEPAIHLPQLSEKYDLTGAAILNVVHFAALKSLARSDEHIRLNDLIEGVKREYKKDERTINL